MPSVPIFPLGQRAYRQLQCFRMVAAPSAPVIFNFKSRILRHLQHFKLQSEVDQVSLG